MSAFDPLRTLRSPLGNHYSLRRSLGAQGLNRASEKSRSATVLWTTAAIISAAVVFSAIGIASATHESDVVSVERQARTAQHSIDISIDELALQQEAVAIWDDAAAHLVAERRDMTWIHDNIGSWLYRMFSQSEVFILDGMNQLIYSAVSGRSVPDQRYNTLKADLTYLVENVRGPNRGPNGMHDRNPGQPLGSNSTVRTTSRATHDSHLMLVGGRPAVASAMLVQPSTDGYVTPVGDWPVLVSVRYLDGAFLNELRKRQLIAAPRLSASPETSSGEHAIPLRTEWGEEIAYLIWKPELPGTRIANRLVPLSLVVLFIVALLMAFMAKRLRGALRSAEAAASEAQRLASHDPLTGLPNRTVLQARLEELTAGGRCSRPFALILIDVDEFKMTNDTLGHDAGDALLKEYARRLRTFVTNGNIVTRLGGDEFGLLLMDATKPEYVEQFSRELVEILSEPVRHEGKLIDCQASAGASVCTGPRVASDLLKEADLALYASKAAGRGTFRLYTPHMSSRMRVRQKMISFAKAALEGDFVEPFYQPKIDLRSGAIVGFEALLRCRPQGKALYGPSRIAAAFEDNSLAAQLGDRMLSRVIADAARWRAAELDFGHVAINVAAADLRRPNFAQWLMEQLKSAGLGANDLQIEVTETVLLGRMAPHVRRTLEGLHEQGIKIALDDFGTGFASLTHLKEFPVNIIKIDRVFVRNLQVDEHDGAIVHALIGLANALGLEVVAEGVETTAQRDFLRALGCTTAQGYLFGRAEGSASVPALLTGPAGSALAAA